MRPADTSIEAWDKQLEALRRLAPEERLEIAAEMSEALRRLVESGVRSRHPEYTPDEMRAAVAEILLGPGLGRAARRGRAAPIG